jgi:hypothetical protein
MRSDPARPRRGLALIAALGIPALVALLPVQAAFAGNSSPSTLLSATTSAARSTATSTTSGLGLSSFSARSTTAPTSTSGSGSGENCGGNVLCTDGVTFASGSGPAVCSLYLAGNALQSPSSGCASGTTSAKGNLALALGRTNVNSALAPGAGPQDPLLEADTCGLALALDQGSGSTAKVVCGSTPGLGSSSVDLGNVMAVLGPTYASLSQAGDLAADVCGAGAALGLNDTSTSTDVYCETLSSAQNWESSIPATTLSVGDNLLSADVQKTFVFVNLTQGVAVTFCDVNIALFGNRLLDTGQVNVALPTGAGPTVNCSRDANENPIVSNGALNLALGNTGAGGGLNEAGGSGGSCGAGGGGTQGGPGSTTNSCGTSTPPPGYQTVPGASNGANATGNLAVVLGQNNAHAGPNSGPGGSGDLGAGASSCGGAGAGGPSGSSAGVKCQQFSYVRTAVEGAHTTKAPAAPPPATAPEQLAKTGFPLLSGLLGVILLALGSIETWRRRRGEATS